MQSKKMVVSTEVKSMTNKTIETKSESETEYLEIFGYREYKGIRTSRLRRLLSIVEFEVRSTWSRSTFGKVLLVSTFGQNLGQHDN